MSLDLNLEVPTEATIASEAMIIKDQYNLEDHTTQETQRNQQKNNQPFKSKPNRIVLCCLIDLHLIVNYLLKITA